MRFTTQGFAGLPKWRERIEEGERIITEAGGKHGRRVRHAGTLRRRRDLRGARTTTSRSRSSMKLNRYGAEQHGDATCVHARGGGGDRAQAVSGVRVHHPWTSSATTTASGRCVRRARRDVAFGVQRARPAAWVPGFPSLARPIRTSSTRALRPRARRDRRRGSRSSARAGCCTSSRRRARIVSNASEHPETSCCSSSAARTGTSSATGISSIAERDLARKAGLWQR